MNTTDAEGSPKVKSATAVGGSRGLCENTGNGGGPCENTIQRQIWNIKKGHW